jgi:asparagine synthase (glutamine-hydrolysing)
VCGICGIVAFERPAERETAAAMSELLVHRGPDGNGLFAAEPGVALGSRRLAIIDLSEAGAQPFSSEDGAHVLVHNGEIYNYRELRAELELKGHRFRSGTDTEVVLAAYREWGEACVARFNGMWAFALWDARGELLFCSRDRFGVKPLYYRLTGGRLAFASELKAFRADPETLLAANERLVRDYLEHGRLEHTDETFFAGIASLAPAHTLVFDRTGLRVTRYWRLEPGDPPGRDPAEAVRELFLDSVRLRLRSDVPVGTCLSGGLDSSTLVCTVDRLFRTEVESARPLGERQKTFTAFFDDPGLEERPYAEAVVAKTGAEPHWISFTAADLVDKLPAVVEAQDEPFGSTSIVAQWYVMRAARQAGVVVMLDGQGSDELFAGYPSFFGYRFADLLLGAEMGELRAEVAAYRREHGASTAQAASLLVRALAPDRVDRRLRAELTGSRELTHPRLRALPATEAPNGSPFPDRLRRRLGTMMTRRGIPELLHSEDRNSMAHTVEARVPYLDYRLVELVFSLEARNLIDRGRTKAVLLRALGDLLPRVVRERKTKLGFPTPEARFFREELGTLAAEVFGSRAFAERGWVDPQAARRRLERHRSGELSAGFELWRALNLELWARAFLDAPTR